jgi:hypothetical protein
LRQGCGRYLNKPLQRRVVLGLPLYQSLRMLSTLLLLEAVEEEQVVLVEEELAVLELPLDFLLLLVRLLQ